MARDPRPPLPFASDPDPDARTPCDRSAGTAAFFDKQRVATEVVEIVRQRDAHRSCQVARAAAEDPLGKGFRRGPNALCLAPAALPHEPHAFDRTEGANQHGGRTAFTFGNRVDECVNAVVEVDVRAARRSVQRGVARRWSTRGVTRGIGFADVGLDFDDHAARHGAAPPVHEQVSEQIARDLECGAIVELAWKLHRRDRCRRRAAARAPALATTGSTSTLNASSAWMAEASPA